MSVDDDVREQRLGQERVAAGDSDVSGDWRESFTHSRDQGLTDTAAAALGDMVAALLGDMVTQFENLGGLNADRVEAILSGEEATNGELEELGYACVELMRALRQV